MNPAPATKLFGRSIIRNMHHAASSPSASSSVRSGFLAVPDMEW
jgi:hypothetical protein